MNFAWAVLFPRCFAPSFSGSTSRSARMHAGSLHGAIQVGHGAHRDAPEHALGGRLYHFGAAAIGGIQPGAADEQLVGFAEEALGGFADAELLQILFDLDVHCHVLGRRP